MKIICPIDLGEASLNAINFAAHIIQRTSGSLTLLHLEPGLPSMETEDFVSDEILEVKAEVVEKIRTICIETEKTFGIACDFLIKKAEINQLVKNMPKNKFDLLVMGTNGASSLEKYLFGNNTTEVMKECEIPILAVPSDYYDTVQKHITFASELRKGEKESIIELVNYARHVGADVTVIHVAHGSIPEGVQVIKEFRASIAKQFGVSVDVKFKQIVSNDVEDALKDYIRNKETNLLAMLAHHQGFFQNLFHDSLSRKMTLLAEVPVLVFHQ